MAEGDRPPILERRDPVMLGVLGFVEGEEQAELLARGGSNVRILGAVESLAQLERGLELI